MTLPVYEVLDELRQTLQSTNRLVLQAPPGAGKTTAVPIALLQEAWLNNQQIMMLEPRRLAARNSALRMADMLGEKVGQTVGYQIRQDHCFSQHTKILVVTEGILTRKLQADPELKNIALVIFDEFHERSLHADLSLALCLQSQQILREDLKILVMSATLNTQAITALLDNAPLIQSEGRCYPVDIHYLDQPLTKSRQQNKTDALMQSLVSASRQFLFQQQGSCLIFLPGVKEINQLYQRLQDVLQAESIEHILLAPLHGSLTKAQQDQAILPAPEGWRKIVLATNIAETSLTIEGIDCVIDSGLERVLEYSPASAMNYLKTQMISADSATQRSGRAGRLSAGICYRLWPKFQQLNQHASAEVLRSDLSSLVLELANWGVQDVSELQWLDQPPASAIEQGRDLLQRLHAIDASGRITQHGKDMLKLGSHPRLAHMMLSAIAHGQAYHACLIAALLTEKDLYLSSAEKTIDIHDRLAILQGFKSGEIKKLPGINTNICRQILKTADDFFKRLKGFAKSSAGKIDKSFSGVLLAYAYPDRIAKLRHGNRGQYLLSNGKGAKVPDYLQGQLHEYMVVANLDAMKGRSSEASIYLAEAISLQQLEDYFADDIKQQEVLGWNEKSLRVEAKLCRYLGSICLQEKTVVPENKQAVHECLLKAIQQNGLQCLNWTAQAESLKQRVDFIAYHIKQNEALKKQYASANLPDFSDTALLENLSDWLQPHLSHENSFKKLQQLDVYQLLLAQLSWDQQQQVNQLAPEKITVPSGSAIKIDYSDISQPVLAVRLQEVFGLYETPALLNGQVKLMMHLLSPARRPMQVTQDLNSFWKTTYHEVKKELRGKYKRHYWPDDPFTAQATSKTKKQMKRN